MTDDKTRRISTEDLTDAADDYTCDPIELLASDFTERQRRGEHPSVDEYASRHPDLADRIRRLFPLIVAVEEVKRDGDHSSDGRVTTGGREIRQLGDFRIVREMGRGGMGIVYEAEQQSLRRRVAVKILPPQSLMSERSLPRFQREARTAARLHHPHIVPVFGSGEADGVHYLVMQLIDGHGLDRWLTAPSTVHAVSATQVAACSSDFEVSVSSPPLPSIAPPSTSQSTSPPEVCPQRFTPHQIAEIGRQVTDAVAYAHSEGVQHRDIKPGNILINDDHHVWVADFGLARCLHEEMTMTQSVGGSLRYMPPERFSGEGDERSDIYAIGVTLYELAVGGPAFLADDATQLVAKVGKGEIANLRSRRRDVPRDLETIVMKALHHDARMRYQTAGAMLEDLERFLAGRTILARRARLHERCWRWAKRNPLAATASLITVLAMIVAYIALGVGYHKTTRANRRVESAFRKEERARKVAETTVTMAVDALNEIIEELAPGGVSFESSIYDSDEDPVFEAVVNAPTPQVARVLERLIPLYGKLAEQAENHDTPQREHIARQAATAGAKLGSIHFQLGNYSEAAKALRRSIELLGEIPLDNRDVEWARQLASIGNDLGAVLAAQRKIPDALRAHREVLNVLEGFEESAESVPLRFEVARAHYFIASFGHRGQRGPAAPRSFGPRGLIDAVMVGQHIDIAVAELEDLRSEPLYHDQATLVLARALNVRASLRARDRDLREKDGQRSMELMEQLVRDHPQEPSFQFELAKTLSNAEPIVRFGPPGRWRAVEARQRRALDLLTDLANRYPTVPIYAVHQAEACFRLSGILTATKRSVAGREQLRAALDITAILAARYPDHPSYQALRLRLYRNLIRSYERDNEQQEAQQAKAEMRAEVEKLPPSLARRTMIQEVVRSVLGSVP